MRDDRQFRDLCGVYAEQGDEQLLELHEGREDLTEVAQEALAAVMKQRGIVAWAERREAESDSGPRPELGEGLAEDEAALWMFRDAMDARRALDLLQEEGIGHRVVERIEKTPDGLREVVLGLVVVVLREDNEAAVELLRERMGLFPEQEVEGAEAIELKGVGEMVLLSMFDRSEGLVVAEALGRAGISYCWRDGSEETEELPDEMTVAIEVREERLERAKGVVVELGEGSE